MTEDYLGFLLGVFCVVSTVVTIVATILVIYFLGTRNRLRRSRSVRRVPLTVTSRNMALAEGFRRIGQEHSRFGELWRITDYGFRSGMTRLRVNPGTSSEAWLPVPPDVETPREAAAWTYDIAPADFDPNRT